MIFSGDFCQLGPVKPFEHCLICGNIREKINMGAQFKCSLHGEVDEVDKWAFCSDAWKEADPKMVLLSEVHRQTDDDFKRILFKLWLGKQLTADEQSLLTDHEFTGMNPVRLFPTKKEVNDINRKELRALLRASGLRAIRYSALDDFKAPHGNNDFSWKNQPLTGDPDHLRGLEKHRYEAYLDLAQGSRVLLLKNLDVDGGLYNGAAGTVVGFKPHDQVEPPKTCSFDSGYEIDDRNEELVDSETPIQGASHYLFRHEQARRFIDRAEKQVWSVVQFDNGRRVTIYAHCDIEELGDREPYILMSRTQIPLLPAWAITVHKAQGMTLMACEVNLAKTFEQGQMYVALSRATNLGGLLVKGMKAGFVCGSGNPEVHRWLYEKFRELRSWLREGGVVYTNL